jgi:hypothetical protein
MSYYDLVRSRTTPFAFFSRTIKPIDLLGARPQTPRVGFAEVWVICKAEQRFLLLFLEKNEIG